MDFVVIRNHINSVVTAGWIAALQGVEQIPEERLGVTRPTTIMDHSGAAVPAARQIVFSFWPGVSTSTGVPLGIHG